jgi:hypothetical protein
VTEPTLPALATADALPATYDAAQRALAACERVDECKDWSDKAAALAAYARMAKNDNLRVMALRIQARAERRCGELLKLIPRGDEATRYGRDAGDLPVTRTGAADAAGLSERHRKAALRIANVPETEFERAVESVNPPSVAQLAERGKVSREVSSPVTAGPARAASLVQDDAAAEAQSALAAFAEFCGEHDAQRIAQSLSRADARVTREHIALIDEWLGRFIESLAVRSAVA